MTKQKISDYQKEATIKPQLFINRLELIQGRIHLLDVVTTSRMADQVPDGMSSVLNDAWADLDDIVKELRALLRGRKGKKPEEIKDNPK